MHEQDHTATILTNGTVLVTGGYNDIHLNSAELYDPSSGLWTTTGSMNNARAGHTATLLTDRIVLVTGGYNGAYLNSAELYDPLSGIWIATGSMKSTRSVHTATTISNWKSVSHWWVK